MRLGKCSLVACRSCGSWTYQPRPGASAQAKVHDSSEYFEHPYFELRRAITPRQSQRCREVFERLSGDLDINSLRGERILDIGCDTGIFLKVAEEEFGIIPIGIDVAHRAVELARQRGLEVYNVGIEEAPSALADFRLVTAIDLIEHVPDPGAFLHQLRQRLRSGGLLYLETPNIRSAVYRFGRLLFRVTGGRPPGLLERLFPPQHVQYFNPESLRHLAHEAGFDCIRVGTRALQAADIAAGWAPRLPIAALQALDRLSKNEILIWAVLRRGVQEV